MRGAVESPLFKAGDGRFGSIHGYACALCNEYDAHAPGDLCGRCSMSGPIVCTRCNGVQQQYGPCIHCETGR